MRKKKPISAFQCFSASFEFRVGFPDSCPSSNTKDWSDSAPPSSVWSVVELIIQTYKLVASREKFRRADPGLAHVRPIEGHHHDLDWPRWNEIMISIAYPTITLNAPNFSNSSANTTQISASDLVKRYRSLSLSVATL